MRLSNPQPEKKAKILEAKARIRELEEEMRICSECMREAIEEQEDNEYINYFDNHISSRKKEIRQLKDDIISHNPLKHHAFAVSVLALIGVMLVFFISSISSYNSITGFSVLDENNIDVYKLFTENSESSYTISGSADSFSLSGSFIGSGRAKAYVVYGGEKALILDTAYLTDKGKITDTEISGRDQDTTFTFSRICMDSCKTQSSADSVKLVIETEDATLYLTKLSYGTADISTKNIEKTEVLSSKSEETVQVHAEINKPVRWSKKVKNENAAKIEIEIPRHAENVEINKFEGSNKIKIDKSRITEKLPLGFRMQSDDKKTILVDDSVDEIEVEYETSAPVAREETVSDAEKHIIISSDIHYENVLTYTSIDETSAERVLVYWVEDNDESKRRVFDVDKQDTNNNGLVDRLEWITPHLSTQKFIITLNYSDSAGSLSNDAVNDVFIDETYYYISTASGLDVKFVSNGSYYGNISSGFNAVYALNDLVYLGNSSGLYVFNADATLTFNVSYTANISSVNDIDCSTISGFDYCALGTSSGLKVLNVTAQITQNSTDTSNVKAVKFDKSSSTGQILFVNTTHLLRSTELSKIFDNEEYRADTNMTGWWHLGNGNDASGNPHRNITSLSGNAYYNSTNYRFGNGSLKLDGSGDYANIANAVGYGSGVKQFSVMAWVKSDFAPADAGYYTIVARFGGNTGLNRYFQFRYRDVGPTNSRMNPSIIDSVNASLGGESVYTGTYLMDGNWHHVAMTVNFDDGTMRTYIDGNVSSTPTTLNTSLQMAPEIANQALMIGGGISGPKDWNGSIDEVAYFQRALNATEIYDYYYNFVIYNSTILSNINAIESNANNIYVGNNEGINVINSSLFTRESEYQNTTNITAWWHLDNNDNDSSGNEYTGVLNGNAYYNSTNYKYGGFGLELDGTGDYLSNATNIIPNLTKEITIEMWLYAKPATAYGMFMSPHVNAGGGGGFSIYATNFQLYPVCSVFNQSGDTNSLQSTSGMTLGEWHHLACVLNTTHLILYIDGVKNTSAVNTGGVITHNYPVWYIGTQNLPSTAREFNGTIDEFRILFKALSAQEIYEDYKGKIYTYNSGNNGYYPILSGTTNNVTSLALTKDGKTLYAGTNDGTETNGAVSEVNLTSDLQLYNWSSGSGEGLINYTITSVARFGNTSYNELPASSVDDFRLLIGTTSGASLIAAQYLSDNAVNETDVNGNIVNATSPVQFGQNVTIRVNVSSTSAEISNVWAAVWDGTAEASNNVIENVSYSAASSSIYSIPITINGSFEARDYNYSIYINDTEGNEVSITGLNFTVNGSMMITLSLFSNVTKAYGDLVLYGKVNFSDNENASNVLMNVYLNGTKVTKSVGFTANGIYEYDEDNFTVANGMISNNTVNDVFTDGDYYYIATSGALDVLFVYNNSAFRNVSSPFNAVYALNSLVFAGNNSGLFVYNNDLSINASETINISSVNDIVCTTISGFDYCAIGTSSGLKVLNVTAQVTQNSTDTSNVKAVKFDSSSATGQILFANTTHLLKSTDLTSIFDTEEYLYDSKMTLWYHFNNDSAENSTFVKDYSGYNRWGTTSTAIPTPNGKFSGAFNFTNNNMINTNTALSDLFNGTTQTISLWIKPIGNTITSATSYNGLRILVDSSTFFGIFRTNISGRDEIWVMNWDGTEDLVGINYTADEWVHLTYVKDGNTMYAYKNGILASTATSGATQVMTGTLRIGSSGFNGSIDELAVYNRSFSVNEVYDNFRFRSKNATAISNINAITASGDKIFIGTDDGALEVNSTFFHPFNYDNDFASDSLFAEWHLDNSSTDTVSGKTLLVYNNTCNDGTDGLTNEGYEGKACSASNFRYAPSAAESTMFNNTGKITLTYWDKIQRSSFSGSQEMFFAFTVTGGYLRMNAHQSVINWYATCYNGTAALGDNFDPTGIYGNNQWRFNTFIFEWDNTTLYPNFTYYRDGVMKKKDYCQTHFRLNNLYITAIQIANHNGASMLNATIDEIKVYNRTFNDKEVLDLMYQSRYAYDGNYQNILTGSTNNVTALSLSKDNATLYAVTNDGNGNGSLNEINITSDTRLKAWNNYTAPHLIDYGLKNVHVNANDAVSALWNGNLIVGTNSGATVLDNIFTKTDSLGNYNYTIVNVGEEGSYNALVNATSRQVTGSASVSETVDSTNPAVTLYLVNGYNSTNSSVNFSWIATDNIDASLSCNLTFGGSINASNIASLNNTLQNLTVIVGDGSYAWNISCKDDAGNINTSVTRTFTIDTTSPAVSYGADTSDAGTIASRDWVYVNVTVTEQNELNITFVLYNLTALVNSTTSASSLRAINFTGLNNNTIYNYTVTIYDRLGQTNSTSTRNITLDGVNPELNLTYPINGSSLSSSTLNRTLNWTVSDLTLQSCWYSLNLAANISVTCSQNYTNITFVTKALNNITFYANDSLGQQSSFTLFVRMNTMPTVPELLSPVNATEKIYTNLTFAWNASTDTDGDNVTYELWLGNDTGFSLVLHNASTSNTNYSNTTQYDDGIQYWKLRAYDGSEYSNFTEWRQLDIIKAVINITSPANNSIIYPAATHTFSVFELNRTEWIRNVTIQVLGDGIEVVNQANLSNDNLTWSVSYTVPVALNPTTLTLVARAYNYTNNSGSATESINHTIILRVTRTQGDAVSAPVITRLVPDPTNQLPNLTVNVSLVADLDTLLESITFNLTKPDGSSVLLTANYTLDNTTSFLYHRNYTIIPDQLGIYTATATVTDINSQSSNKTILFRAAELVNHTLNKTNAANIKLIDPNTKRTIVENATSQSEIIPGQYDVEITTAKPTVTFFNSTINSTVRYVLNYTDLSENVVPPSGRRSAETFEISSELQFSSGNVTYNYSDINSSIIEASNLEMYKCESTSSCSWIELTVSIDEGQGLITGTVNNLSVFMVAEPTSTSESSSSSSSGGGGGTAYIQNNSQVTKIEAANLNVISPAVVAMNPGDELIVPVIIRNSGAAELSNIDIDASSNDENVNALADKILLTKLGVNHQEKLNVKLTTKNKIGTYEVRLRAYARSHMVADDVVIQVNVMEHGSGNRTTALEMLEFARDLFDKNPECLELGEVLTQGKQMVENKEYEKAATLADSSINACKELVALLSVRVESPGKIKFSRFGIPKLGALLDKLAFIRSLTKTDMIIMAFAGLLVAALLVYVAIPSKKKKRRR